MENVNFEDCNLGKAQFESNWIKSIRNVEKVKDFQIG
jgi:hypothetical protein